MIKDPIAKFNRIVQLGEMGFNTPRMLHCPANQDVSSENILKLIAYPECVYQRFANIRTYFYQDGVQGWGSKHYIKTPRLEVLSLVADLTSKGVECIVDIEDPDNGLYAGSVQLNNDIESSFIIDYCYEPDTAAMVRNASKTVQGNNKTRRSLPRELTHMTELCYEKFNLLYRSVIIEFSCLKRPAGINNQYTIFWEYRNKET